MSSCLRVKYFCFRFGGCVRSISVPECSGLLIGLLSHFVLIFLKNVVN